MLSSNSAPQSLRFYDKMKEVVHSVSFSCGHDWATQSRRYAITHLVNSLIVLRMAQFPGLCLGKGVIKCVFVKYKEIR